MTERRPDAPPPPPSPPTAAPETGEDEAPKARWWKRAMPLWAVILIAVLAIGLGVASAGSDEADVAAGDDVDELEGQLAERENELDDRDERIDELTEQVDRLEGELDEATSTTTTEATTTTTTTTTTTAPPTTAPPTTEDPSAGETPGQRNARQKAGDYLDYSAFSRTGLIEQLEYEGFSTGDATYGVDALNVDWNEQAAKKAAEYLDYSAFSRTGLIDQLVYEGFTQAEAEYGVSTTGL